MAYQVKEVFFSLQGEGHHAGRASVFCRFAGCNLWNGREDSRDSAQCYFCDTDFVGTDGPGGGRFTEADELCEHLLKVWHGRLNSAFASSTDFSPSNGDTIPYLVFTGGEPLLQLDDDLILAAKKYGFEIAVETNGTIPAPNGIDWLTVSPKPNSKLVQRSGNELKLVFPHEIGPEQLSNLDFDYFYLSPLTSDSKAQTEANAKAALAYCHQNPQWRFTFQYHKAFNLP